MTVREINGLVIRGGKAGHPVASLHSAFVRRPFLVIIFHLLLLFIPLGLLAQEESLRINEFMALNQGTITDGDAEYSDWIEIHNPGTESAYLYGWSLTDERDLPRKWIFPDVSLDPGGYMLVFASGKNRSISGQELHTNFRLEGAGEYLGFFNPEGTAVTEFYPGFPEQQTDFSYGLLGDAYVEFSIPTPGGPNSEEGSLLPAPVFDIPHGLYDRAFDVQIISGVPGAEVYYTTDGSRPGAGNGTLYTSPLHIGTTTVLRAVSVIGSGSPARIATCTYIFPADVIRQPNDPTGYPAEWGPYTAITGTAIADYEMDPECVADTLSAREVISALYALPTISLVSERDNFFSLDLNEQTGGIYIYTGPPLSNTTYGPGRGWERPVSFEYFGSTGTGTTGNDSPDTLSLQVDCGILIQGGHARRPEKSPKHSFRLIFRGEYGASRLNFPLFPGEDASQSFNNLILRAGFGLSWIHHSNDERIRAQYIRDAWTKDTQLDMGHPSSRSGYAHLYINGIYWGIYAPSERMDGDFGASYMGGRAEDYDVIKDYAEVSDGTIDAWDKMMAMANAGLQANEAYQAIQGKDPDGRPDPALGSMVDVVSLADYMLINFYGGNTDWDHHNWTAMRNRVDPEKGFRFLCWDAEHMLKTVNENVTGEFNANCPSNVFQQLCGNEEFRRLFADRVQKHCFGQGALAPGPAMQRWVERMNVVGEAVDAESARWGDYRRDVHQWQAAGPFDLYARDPHWLAERDFILNTYFPQRTSVLLDQLRAAGLFPATAAPEMRINDSPVEQKWIIPGDVLTMSAPEGMIYYTTNGTDPANWEPSQPGADRTLIAFNADKMVLVPKSAIGDSWRTNPAYDDSGWKLCQGVPGGVGYEINSGYENMISLDVAGDMHSTGTDPNTSCCIRIPFTIASGDLQEIKSLYLEVLYDDGFVAWLNGRKVAQANAPGTVDWNSAASATHEAGDPETYNISLFLGDLKAGDNLLAIQGLNSNTTSSDFLVSAELTGTNQSPAPVSEDAIMYTDPVVLNASSRIRARTFNNGEWSAVNEKFFLLAEDFHRIKITEIHYHPPGEDTIDSRMFEFLELKNTGNTTLDLGGVRFIDGVEYTFPEETALGPKEFIVLAGDRRSFARRYGFYPFDVFKGQLNNGGEWLVLTGPQGDTLCAIYYNMTGSWPQLPDGYGYSLVPTEFDPANDQNHSSWWRPSHRIGGSPGMDDLEYLSDEPEEPLPVPAVILSQNYPNPFSERTWIGYTLPEYARVRVSVINMLGQEVASLVNQMQQSGSYVLEWDGTDHLGNAVGGGFYFCRIIVKGNLNQVQMTRKMLLVR
jgi:hypothetical protein